MSATPFTTSAAGPARQRRGSALLVVIGMMGLLAILAVAISRSVSSAAFEMLSERRLLRSEEDLRAGIELAVAALSQLGDDVRSADAFVDLGDRRIAVRVINERGRIDLNLASTTMLAGVLQAAGTFGDDATALAASLIEWRGGSASQKLNTAASESAFSFAGPSSMRTEPGRESAPAPQAMLGSRFILQPAQLASVPGFSKAMVKALLPFVTVANGSSKVDPYVMPERALQFLPGASADGAQAFVDARDGNTSRATAIQLLGLSQELATSAASRGWRVEITSTPRTGKVTRSEAVIAVIPSDGDPYRVLYVTDQE